MVRWASAGPAGAHTGIPGGTEGEGAEAMPGSAGWDVHPTLADGWAQVWDPAANAYYYRHEATGAVQWEAPTNESVIHWEYSVDNSEAGEVPQLPAAAILSDQSEADFEPSLVSSLTHRRESSSVVTSAEGTVPTSEEVAAAASITSPAGSLAQSGMPGGTDAEWDVMFDGESGQAYFTHRSKGTTTWEVPADMSSTQIDGQVASYLSEDSSTSQSIEGSAFAPNPSPPDNMVDTSTPLEGTGMGQDGIGLVISPAAASSARGGGLEGESMSTPLGKSGRRGRSRNASRNLPSDELAAEEENEGGTALVFAAPDASPPTDTQDEAATPPAGPYPEEGQDAGGEWQPPPPMAEEGEAVNEWQMIEVQRRRSSTQGLSPSQVLAALGWQELYDPGTGAVYYFHPDSGETRWSSPLEEENQGVGQGPEQEGQEGQTEEAEGGQQEATGEVAMMQWAPQPTQEAQEQRAWAAEAQAGAQGYAPTAEDGGAAQWDEAPVEMRASMDSSDLAVSAAGEGTGEWQEHVDVGTGQLYYYNNVTAESRWDPPPELQLALAQEGTQPVGEAWQEMYDPVTGQLYFYNEETQESRWALAGPTGEGLDGTGQAGGGYEDMVNPYDVGGEADNTGALMVTDYSLLETLHRQAGGELEELQRAVHAQNSLVQALERSVYGLHPVAMAAGSQQEAQQDMMQQQADIIRNLESVVGNVQELARGLLTRKPTGAEGEEGGAGSGVEGPNRSVVIKAPVKKEQDDDDEPEGLEGLLNFAFDEEDEEMRKRVEAAKKQEEEEGPEEEGQGPRKRSDKLLRTVPTRLIRAWRQRKSRKVQEIAKGTAAVTRFSIRNLAKAKGRFKEMLVELKERDRFMDLKFAEPDSDSESEYEEVDLEDLFPHSIVLGQRGQFLELLEPRKAFIYYQNLRTGKFQKQVPNFEQEEVARKPVKPVEREGNGKAPKPAPLIGHSDAGQLEERARSQRTLFTERHWAERLKVMRKRRGRKGEGRRGASVFQIPALQVLSDPRLTKLYHRQHGGASEQGEASVATTGSTTTGSLGKPTSLRRPKPAAPSQETNDHSNQGASDKQRPSVGTTLTQGLSATMPFLIPPGTLRSTRKAEEGEASGEEEGGEEGEEKGEEEEKDKEKDKEPKPAAPRFINGGPVRPFFGRIGSAKRHLTQQREEALRRSAHGPQQRDLRSRVAAKRAHFFEQQNQSRLLDDICQELLWLLRRHNRQPQSCRRRDYVELLQFQASCVGMAQHKPTPACPTPGDGKTSPTGSQGQQLQGQADETTVRPMAPDQTTRPQQREFEFKGLRLVKDDGFWVQLESSDGRRQWAREQQGWPWVQPGQPLRYRLLELVHASSLHHRMEGGWQEHRWKEGMQATGESRAYFNQLTHAVTWRKPAALQFLPIIESAAASQGAHGSKASGQGGKPRPKAPSVGLLKPQSQSALTATLVDMLREPNPHNGQSVLAVAGFALLLVQGGMFAQALPALRRAVALCLAEEDQEREKEHKAALAAQEDGSSEGEEDGDGTGKKKKPRMPSAASKAAVLRAARQRAMLCLALSRLCLLTGDFRTAEETARLTASKASSDASVLCGVGDVLMHLCRRDEAEHVLLASLLLDPQSQPTFRAYARLCAARGQAEFADSYYRRAVAACNDTQALEKPNYREAAETCLEYACYLLEPWERKVPEAERLLRQALGWLTTRGQPQGFGLAYAPPPPERPDTDVDSHLMADVCFALGRLYHLHRRDGSHATAYYRQACKLRPNYYAALLHHACLLATSRRTDDHRDADGLFRRALSLPEASTPHARLLPPLLYAHFLAATLGDTAQAESECVAAMASGSALAVPLVALSSMLSHLPHPTTATRMLCRRLNRRLSQLYPRDPVALVALGMALLQETSEPTPESSGPLPALTELREEALACFDEALRLTNGRFAPALRGKGLLMSQGPDKDTTAALELFLQGLSVMPESVALLRTTAMHLLTHMPLLGAVCPAATPKAPQTRNNRSQKSGEEEEISGDYTEARHQVVAYLSRALSLEPNDASTLATLALVTLRVQPQEAATAERLLHRGVQASILAADKGRCLRLLGHLAYDRGVNVQAAEAFHAALQVCPTDTVAAVGLAACLAASCDGVQVDKPEMQFQAAWANGPPASSYCHLMYGVFKLKMRYDRAAARDLFLFAARDKKRPPNCLALYYLGRIAMMGNKLKEMEKWMVFAIETEPLGFLQVVEWGFMVQELHKDYLAEKVLFEQARRRRKGITSTVYKEKSVERFEALKRIMHYGRLRQQFLVEKRGLDVLAPDSGADNNGGGSFRYTTTFMAEAGWEQRYASLYYGEAESWAALFTAQLACEQARLKANVDRSVNYHRASSPTRALSAKRRPKSACASQHGLRNNGAGLHGAEGRGPKLGMVGELQMELLQARPSTAPAGGGPMSAGKRAALARGEGTLRGPGAVKNRPGSALAYR